MRISKSLLVAAAMLVTASVAQAQQNITGATWIGPALGGSGTWDKWTGTPAHNFWQDTVSVGRPLVSGARLTNTATLTFTYNGPVLGDDPNGVYPTAAVDILHIPYRGTPEQLTSVMRGDSQMSMAFVGTAISFIKSGQVRAVATATAQRYPALPDVPTFAESGMPPNT